MKVLNIMETQYIENHNGNYRITGTRVSLDSIVYAFWEGLSPESIVSDCFPVLNLEQVYGAIAYYLRHRDEIDTYLKEDESKYEYQRNATNDPSFSKRLMEARRQNAD